MKKSLHSLFVAAIVSVTSICAQAAETLSEAVVLKTKGDVQAVLPGQSVPTAVKAGDKLPEGTVIETADKSEVEIQVFSGTVAKIEAGSKVDLSKVSISTENGAITKQTALLNLRIGTVVSTLDPSKKAINDYSIRTPKGVAAARGTRYTVSVSATGEVRTFVARGQVVFLNTVTGQSVTVPNGYVVVVDADGNISEPTEATDAQRKAADDKFKEDTDKERAIDITIISPSN